MQTKHTINSDSYWDGRFAEDWESFRGPAQSRFFARLAIENLPRWLIDQLQRQPLTLCDWGCAQGDGTDVWASYVDSERITGVDFSSVAIEQASQRYPAIRFLNEDWLVAKSDEQSVFDIVFSSNTLEHFHKPYSVLKSLCNRAMKALVFALPYRELDRHHEHFYTFLPGNIPSVIGGGFRLIWSRVVDCRQLPNTHWSGDQIVLVYAQSDWVDSLGLALKDFAIEQSDSVAETTSLNQAIAERDGKIVGLSQAVAERDGQIISLNQAVAERDGQIVGLSQAVAERDGQIISLNQAVAERDGQITSLNQAVAERDGQITSLNQAVAERDGQITSLNQAVAERDGQIISLNQAVAERDGQIISLNQAVAERDGQIISLNQAVVTRDMQLANATHSSMLAESKIQELLTSTSWRITAPVRFVKSLMLASAHENVRYVLLKSIYWKLPEGLRLLLNKQRHQFVAKHLRERGRDLVASLSNYSVESSSIISWIGQAQVASKLVIIPCAFEFDELVNQRPINAAKHYSARGFLVLYVAWQWSPQNTLSKGTGEVYPNVIQVPMYDFFKGLNSLSLENREGHYLLTLPSRQFMDTVDTWRSKGGIVVYDIMDDWEAFSRVGQAPWYEKSLEQELILKADFVFAVSPKLSQKFHFIRADICVIGNGYTPAVIGAEKKGIAGKGKYEPVVIGYFGHLTDAWFDWDLLFSVASQLDDYCFEIIGYGEPEWVLEKITHFNNISFIGKVLPSDLHSYVSRWAIGLIPFIQCDLSEAVDPIKIYEYLYFGLPVVVTGIEHVKVYPKTYFANGMTIFDAIAQALADETEVNELNEFLGVTTWEARFDSLMNLISSRKSISKLYDN